MAFAPNRKFSPTDTALAPSFSISTCSMKSSALRFENSLSKGITTSSSTPSPSITSRFTFGRHDQLRRRLGWMTVSGMRIEGQHRVGVVDHGLVAQVDAVEGPDRDVAVATGLGVRELVT